MHLFAKLNATAVFLQEVISRPRQIGAIVPSSNNLARAMARWLPADAGADVLELGPGTGAVTDALLEGGLSEDRLVAIEKSPKMADLLRRRFPHARILTGDALELDRLLTDRVLPRGGVAAVFSSLPLLVFPPAAAKALAGKIFDRLRPGGNLVQYSYHLGRRCSPALGQFRHSTSDVVWFNLPPARVSVYQKPGLEEEQFPGGRHRVCGSKPRRGG